MLLRERDGVLGYNRLPGGGMCSDKHRVAHLEMEDRFLLESVQFEGVLAEAIGTNISKLVEREKTHFMGHLGHEFVKVFHRLVDIHHMRPIPLVYLRTLCGTCHGSERVQLRSLP